MTAKFDLYPSLHTHVAIDTSLFGWVLPQTPMVFSTFRDPVDRLLSSFHYGIQFGGGKTIVCIVYYVHDKLLNCVIDILYAFLDLSQVRQA